MGRSASSEHKEVYHAAPRCQAPALSETSRRLYDRKKVCSDESQITGVFASQPMWWLDGPFGVGLPGRCKDDRVIARLGSPHAIQKTQPHIGKSPQSHRMTLAFRPFVLIVGVCPGFLGQAGASKLIQCDAQWFETGMAAMRLPKGAALVKRWSRHRSDRS